MLIFGLERSCPTLDVSQAGGHLIVSSRSESIPMEDWIHFSVKLTFTCFNPHVQLLEFTIVVQKALPERKHISSLNH